MADQRADDRRRAWRSEARRTWISAGVGTVAAVVLVTTWISGFDGDPTIAVPFGTIVAWAGLVGTHAALTGWAFAGLRGDVLREAVGTGVRRPATSLWPGWSVQVSAMALIVVAVMVVVPTLRAQPLLLACALVMVIAAWADLVASFALHYATLDGHDELTLAFPDDDPRAWADYVYLAVTVQATFATPDVTVIGTPLRRQVALHTLLAFVFNTVILAVVITLLLT